ncbi:MAG: FAD-containing oxidoreductase [Gemmatimonas sp.]|nr:FAD-containing oxidoreductase [Gemmatimonas sp.]
MAQRFDAIIIGTGQAGQPLSGALSDAGWQTAIIERGRVGGTCLIDGCTPSKTMIASARVAYLARRAAEYGVRAGPIDVDLPAVVRRKATVVDDFSAASERRMTERENLELIIGEARFVGPAEIEVKLSSSGTRRLTSEKIFINAGARPAAPSIPGLEQVDFFDSTSIMELTTLPDHLVVLGGGFVGLEFAQMFRRFGAQVTVLEAKAHLVDREDEDIAEAVEEIFREDGIDVRTSTEVIGVDRGHNGGVIIRVRASDGDDAIHGSHLLVAVGRVPNTDTLDVSRAGLETDRKGYIRVDERLQTNVPGIYALGDIAGSPPFTHIAYDDYRVIRANLLNNGDRTTTDRLLTYTFFIDPQLGRVGMSEAEARQDGLDIRVAKLPMTRVARAIETGETRGLIKALVDARTDRIVGAAVLGIEGGEIVAILQTAIIAGLPYTELRDAIFAHPTLAESLNNLFTALDA